MQNTDDYRDKGACHLNFQTIDWVDVFIRPVYKQVIVHTLNHFIESKGLKVYAWCLMTHHLDLLIQAQSPADILALEKEYKVFTTRKILEAIDTEPGIRKEWMLKRFENSANLLSFSKKYLLWQDSEAPLYIDIRKDDLLLDQFDHIHQAPVRERIVDTPTEYLYSSARDYTGIKGLVNITKLPAVEQQLAAAETMNGNFFVKYIRN
jgi:putative transposase